MNQQRAALPEIDRRALQALWVSLFDRPPNASLRREVLVPILAYRLQEKAYGGLKASVAKQLRLLVERGSACRKPGTVPAFRLKAGTRMVREWNGKLHEASPHEIVRLTLLVSRA